jgi:competence protein ComEC
VAAQHSTLLLPSDVLSLLLVASFAAFVMPRTRTAAYVVTGFVLFQLAAAAVIENRLASQYAGDSLLTTVRIMDFPQASGESVTMSVEAIDDARIPPRVRLSWFQPPVMPAIGEVWELELRLRRPRGRFNPGGFDRESWLFREKYHATGYVVAGKRNRLLWSGATSAVDQFRARFARRALDAADSDESGAVLAAIGVGVREHVSRPQWDRYAATGTTHLMAISGLHVGLAALVGFVGTFAASACWPIRGNRYAGAVLLGVAVAAVYAGVSGFGVPARRAVIMLLLVALTVAGRRQVSPSSIVACAAVVVFVSDPVATLTPGFHLSFGAVVLLVWLAQRMPAGGGVIVRPVRQLIGMQVFLMFGLLPLTALIFRRFALLATPVNLLAVPLFSFVTVPLTVAALIVGEASEWLADNALRIAAMSVDVVEAVTALAAAPAFANDKLAELSGGAFFLLLLPLAWVVLPRGWPGREVALIGAAALVFWKPAGPPATCFDTWVLDVGQGLAVVVQSGDDVTVYDTGMAWPGGATAAEQVVLPFLSARGIARIDRLIVSHADLDHSGGVRRLWSDLHIDHIILGERLPGIEGWLCAAGQRWWSGAVRYELLHPGPEERPVGNDASCVLRVATGPHALLLSGDVEAGAERELLQRGGDLGSDVVIVPHHGSLTSSSKPFVDAVSPRVAVVSAAYANRWGFPRAPVVERWRAVGADVLSTARDGAVFTRICASGGAVEVRSERERRHRFWHAVD